MLTPEEKQIIKLLIQGELKNLEREGKGALIKEDFPNFIGKEEQYKVFLKKILEKL